MATQAINNQNDKFTVIFDVLAKLAQDLRRIRQNAELENPKQEVGKNEKRSQ